METQVTCPQCHIRCRLKNDSGKSSRGKCPECGAVFPIPPGIRKTPSEPTQETAAGHQRYQRLLPAGLALLLMAGAAGLLLLISSRQTPTPSSVTETIAPVTAARPSLDPETRSEILARIRRHALVGDAGIRLENNRYRLFLLVSRNTPPTYAEELGRQFAFYLERRLQQNTAPVLPIEVSVYYPGGTRLEVSRSRHNGEEEVLPTSNNFLKKN